jgi:hypothetical protein
MLKKIFYTLLVSILSINTFAATITANAGGGDWNTAGTWDCTCIPSAADDVIIPTGISVTTAVALSVYKSISVTGILTVNGGNLDVTSNHTITINNGGEITISGANNLRFLTNSATPSVTIASGGTLNIGGSLTSNDNTSARNFVNSGFVEIGANISSDPITITNNTTGVILVHGGIAGVGSVNNFYNYGLVTIDQSINLFKTNFYNYSTGRFFDFGDVTIDNSSTFYNYGLLQSNSFNIANTNFVNASCTSNYTGTISANTGTATVTGTGTLFTSEVTVGDLLTRSSDCKVLGKVLSITDNTTLTLAAKSNFNTAGSVNYGISLPGTIITLTSFNETASSCPGCSNLNTMGNIYYSSYTGLATNWCAPPTCEAWFLAQPSFQAITPGRRLWLSADFLGYGLGNDGDKVKRWFDLANTFGFYMTQSSTTYQPITKNNATDNLNFNPLVSFSGGEKRMDLTNHYLEANSGAGGGLSMFAVVVPASGSTGTPHIFDFGLRATNGYGLGYSAQSAFAYTATSTGSGNGAQNTVAAHGRGTNPTLLSSTTAWSGNQTVFINGTTVSGPTAVTLTQLRNTEINEAATATATNGPFTLGWASTTSSAYDFEGNVGEIIIYANLVSTITQESVQSFLALKYGLTVPHAYRDYAGNIVRAVDATYSNDIAGLAREDLNVLHQKKSKSCNAGAELTISTAAINNSQYNQKLVSTNITNNRSYIIWGHNGNAANSGNRVYKITASNFKQQVYLQFAIPLATAPILLVADDAAFTINVNGIYGSSDGTYLTYNNTFSNNKDQYFKLLIPSGTSTPGVLISEIAPLPTIKNTAELQVYSTSKGVLLPALADTSTIAKVGGMIFYNTTHNRFMYYDATATAWKFVGAPLRQTQAVLSSSNGFYTGEIRYNLTSHTLWIWYDSAWHELNHN